MIKSRMLVYIGILFMLFPIAFLGCSGGGGGGGSVATSPSIQVSPSAYDFGSVTLGNTPAALEVTIENNG